MFTKEQKKAAYKKLPEKLREVITSSENIERVEVITKKFSLTENQKDLFDSETLNLMMGFETDNEFVANIEKHLGIDEGKALEIFRETDKKIFQEVRSLIPKPGDQPVTNNQQQAATEPVLPLLSKEPQTNNENRKLDDGIKTTLATEPAPVASLKPPVQQERKWWEQRNNQLSAVSFQERKDTNDQRSAVSFPARTDQTTFGAGGQEKPEQTSQVPEVAPEMELTVPKIEKKVVEQAPAMTPKTPDQNLTPKNLGDQTKSQSKSFLEKIVQTPINNEQGAIDENKVTKVDETLSKLAEDEGEWQKRKETFVKSAGDKIVKSDYQPGQDPYREPLS